MYSRLDHLQVLMQLLNRHVQLKSKKPNWLHFKMETTAGSNRYIICRISQMASGNQENLQSYSIALISSALIILQLSDAHPEFKHHL